MSGLTSAVFADVMPYSKASVLLAAWEYLDVSPVLKLPREVLLDGLFGHFVRNVEYSHPFGTGRIGKRPREGIDITVEDLRVFVSHIYQHVCPRMGGISLGGTYRKVLAHIPALKQLERKER